MTSRRDTVRAGLFLVFAVAAPWDVFLFVPVLHLHLAGILAFAIIALEFVDYVQTRRVGVRFELLWPACALLVLALPPFRVVPLRGALAILLGLAAARSVGPLLTRNIVAAMALSIGLLGLYTLVFLLTQLAAPGQSPSPSAYSLDTGVLAPFGNTVTECAALLFLGLAAASSRFLRNDCASKALRRTVLALAAPLVIVLCALVVSSLDGLAFWRPRDYFASTGMAAAALIGGWLLARTLAKSFIHWREMRYTISEDTTQMLAGLVFFALLFPLEFRLFWGFVAGIAAGAAQSDRELAPPPPKWTLALLPLAILVILNGGGVHPADTNNPRHYESAARQDFARGDYARLENRLDCVETYWPNERRTHLWRARAALAQDLLHEAAYEIMLACRPAGEAALLLPPPSPDEIDAFLVRLRDACSESASRTPALAHIQALLGAGKFNHAEALLEQALVEAEAVVLPEGLSADLDTAAYGCPCSWPLRAAAMKTVWPVDFEEPPEFAALFPEDLAGAQWLRLLIRWGAELRTAPPNLPRETLPLVCLAKCHRAAIELACLADGALLARTDALTEPAQQYDPEARYAALELVSGSPEQLATWGNPETRAADVWTITLEIQDTPIAAAQLETGITLVSTPPAQTLPAPDTPIISIWL